MINKMLAIATASTIFISGAASADIRVTTRPGTVPYTGGTTFDFDSTIPTNNCPTCIVSGPDTSRQARPLGSTGQYFSVGPTTSTNATITLSQAGAYWLSFIWGSVDDYNTVSFKDAAGNVLKSFNGVEIAAANGDRVSPSNNPVVTFHFSGTDAARVSSLAFNSRYDAFEIDNIRVVGVPEPTTWGMMILGFGMIGGVMRRRAVRKVSVA